ncbi:uncharacterized protein LOC110030524 [Phalaenopsis equestris]|uniref:uncharacterized protein LOC110030524 n=1 Tax=Phalaenopsis equestris TaxID=78828 RepID=UPI0009E4289E|nr:uncharacterized protein LOC110030524 [Phalaenopsis equestris]
MNYFNDQSNLAGLYDLGFSGPQFTWRRGQTWERLDRIFVNSMWFSEFIHTSVHHLSMTRSDHGPLLMNISASNVKHKPSFRYLNKWSSHHDFLNQVSLVWRDCHHLNPLIKIWQLQKKLGRHLSNWNWKTVGDINLNVVEAEKTVAKLEAKLESNPEVEKDLLVANENLMNVIYLIAASAVNYYQTLFKQPSDLRPPIQHDLFCRDENFMRALDLTSIPREEEIWSALVSIDNSKVAGPDGFSADFYKKSWKIIKDDIV